MRSDARVFKFGPKNCLKSTQCLSFLVLFASSSAGHAMCDGKVIISRQTVRPCKKFSQNKFASLTKGACLLTNWKGLRFFSTKCVGNLPLLLGKIGIFLWKIDDVIMRDVIGCMFLHQICCLQYIISGKYSEFNSLRGKWRLKALQTQ